MSDSQKPFTPKMVKIMNPAPGGTALVQYSRAAHYVKVGRAKFISPARILLDTDHPRYQMSLASWREKNIGYDQRGSMTLKEIRNIPLLSPQKMRK